MAACRNFTDCVESLYKQPEAAHSFHAGANLRKRRDAKLEGLPGMMSRMPASCREIAQAFQCGASFLLPDGWRMLQGRSGTSGFGSDPS